MTPAINSARHAGIAFQLHEYQHDAAAPSYGLEAADKLGVTAEQVFKTLVVSLDGKQLAVGIVPVNSQLGLKQIAKAAGHRIPALLNFQVSLSEAIKFPRQRAKSHT